MRKIIWSPEAKADFENNIDYLLQEWTDKEAQRFIDDVFEVLYMLQKSNVEFKLIGFKDIRAVTVCQQISLLYRLTKKNEVELVRFWDDRQNPEKLKKSLK
jgi:plasmid stabilization system protein ParE